MRLDLLTVDFFPVVGIIFLIVFLWKNSNMEMKVKVRFYQLILVTFVELIVYNFELILPEIGCSIKMMTLVTALGYCIRPIMIYMLISIIIRKDDRKRIMIPLTVPAVICAVVSFSAMFTDIAYSYDSELIFHRGLLGWTPHIVMLVYLTLMIIFSFTHKGVSNSFERIIIIEIVVIIIAATVAESFFGSIAVLRAAVAASIIFYYMYFESEVYKDEIISKQKAQIAMSEHFSLQMVKTLAETVDAKDSYTKGHSYRVAEYAEKIAAKMGRDEEFRKRIFYMGMLHDIGKIGIPDNIINKKGELTDEEFRIIKTHPQIGADVLKNITEMPTLYYGARWHHERYDGTGYPDGLKGRDIPIEARIISVADAYDAMTSKRSYRDALPQEAVRQEIVNAKGTQMDPAIADIMLEMIDSDKEYKLKEH